MTSTTTSDRTVITRCVTAADWAIHNGYTDIETDTSEEFCAWQECESVLPIGVKAWRDYSRDCYVAILRHDNGEQMGDARGYGQTMLEALQDL